MQDRPSNGKAGPASAGRGGVRVFDHEARADQLFGEIDHRIGQERQRHSIDQHALARAFQNQIIGCGIVGPNAGDLIAEAALAIELGADAADIGLTIHPHPTLSETVAMAAEAFERTITDLYMPKKKAPKKSTATAVPKAAGSKRAAG